MFSSPSNESSNPGVYNNNNNSYISNHVNLKAVDELPEQHQSTFSNFQYFNVIQSTVFDSLLYTDESIVVSAPTGSGKTVIFELAIINFLNRLASFNQQIPYKVIYVAPVKALCEERLVDWYTKFSALGLSCISVTGDTDYYDFKRLITHNFIITTPEKWDVLTRRWRDNRNFIPFIKLFMIDEVHILNDNQRGPTVEVIISRMKAIHNAMGSTEYGYGTMNLRFIAASATIPNVEDVAEWLTMPMIGAKAFKFGDDMRPVKLKKVVLGYNYNPYHSSPFKFDITLNYKLQSIILQYAEGKPTLIFCSTRKNVEMTATYLTQNLTINLQPSQRQVLVDACANITEPKIKQLLAHGVSFHHAGLLAEDRRIVENLFRNSSLPILVTTSTLAMGINLPAHLVIVKSTKHYSNGEYQDCSESMLLQMIGRAGRPQYDTTATAVILTTASDKARYENMLGGSQSVESSLHTHLIEHVNAEVVLHTITDLGVAMEWLTSTFLYIRARKNPKHYGLPAGLNSDQIDNKLLEMCQVEINRLSRSKMLTIDEDVNIAPTPVGSLMAKYYVAFDTMNLFTKVTGHEVLQQILGLISKCKEFSDMYLRVNDKKPLNILNQCHGRQTIRFPLNGKIKTLDMKVNCIIQAEFGCLHIAEPSLINESQKIMRIGERVSSCLAEYLSSRHGCFSALLSALTLVKCFRARLWENSPYVSKQLSKIGNAFATAFANAEKTTFQQLLAANPRDLERIINRKPPMGNVIQQQIEHLPQYSLILTKEDSHTHLSVHLKITLENAPILHDECTVPQDSVMTLLIGDSNNDIVLLKPFKHSEFIETPSFETTFDFPKTYTQEIMAHFISEDWVGIDCQTRLALSANVTPPKNATAPKKPAQTPKKVAKQTKRASHVQMLVDSYFKKSKNCNKKSNSNSNTSKTSTPSAQLEKQRNDNPVPSPATTLSIAEPGDQTSSIFDDAKIKFATQTTVREIVEESNKEFMQQTRKWSSVPSYTDTIQTKRSKPPSSRYANKFFDFDQIGDSNDNLYSLKKQYGHGTPKQIEHALPDSSSSRPAEFKTERFSQDSIEDYMKNLPMDFPEPSSDPVDAPLPKSISWRSPLVISPVVKHPSIYDSEIGQSRGENGNRPFVADSSGGLRENGNVKRMISCSPAISDCGSLFSQPQPRPTLKTNNQSKGFPLSDRDYQLHMTQKESQANLSRSCNGWEDIISSSLLESLQGNSKKVTSTTPKRTTAKRSVPEYYSGTATRGTCSTKTQTSATTTTTNAGTQTNHSLEIDNHDSQPDLTVKAPSINSTISSVLGDIESQRQSPNRSLYSDKSEVFNNNLIAYNSAHNPPRHPVKEVTNLPPFFELPKRDIFDNGRCYPLNLQPIPELVCRTQPGLRPSKRRSFTIPNQNIFDDLPMHNHRFVDLQEAGPSGMNCQGYPPFPPPTYSYPYTNPGWHQLFPPIPTKYSSFNMYNNSKQYMLQQYLNPFYDNMQATHYGEHNGLGRFEDSDSD
ncbi:hypothetical protein PPYR_13708 [Photinus pyralis]|uniref:DNA 3'-5' helicase n=1 Tax=Photinus pyralis TaxID=7054 RepID=A0A5N4AA07_PHOPY|nr:probable ATP-dependent DNA helicase HFM1 isoform X2 [Photinus pyralis]KAB0794088.1 hypothetical protein PPYR_13708 [Photinus pyralis]